MYFPYFHGKQFELVTIRERAMLFADSSFVPIIEPVRESDNTIKKALDALTVCQAKVIVVVNPNHGVHRRDGNEISRMLRDDYLEGGLVVPGVLLSSETTLAECTKLIDEYAGTPLALIHAGFTEPKPLSAYLENGAEILYHAFVEDQRNVLYRRHFPGGTRVLIRDGFRKRKNAEYPPVEQFSELHLTYRLDEGMDGFGDFLIVGDGYSEAGGPAYAVAIHLTFFDPNSDGVMYVYHFVSDSRDTPTDPAGKFSQALEKLMDILDSGNSNLLETSAIVEFRELHRRGHFPGLGYVKKLSMVHHLETISDHLRHI